MRGERSRRTGLDRTRLNRTRARSNTALDQKKSPSRSRFRPQRRLTFRFGPCEPPRTTTRYCFVLLPRRARRKKKLTASPDPVQGVSEPKTAQFAEVE